MDTRLIPPRARILSGSVLKLMAVILMLIDHAGVVIAARCPMVDVLTLFGRTRNLYEIMRFLGRMAFPLFAFLLVEGFLHTRNKLRYALRLGVCALLSEIPFDLAIYTRLWNWQHQNVFFTLLFGFLGLWALEAFRGKGWRQLLSLVALFSLALFSRCDYGLKGYCFILLLYLLREAPVPRAVVGCGCLSSTWHGGLAFVPIAFYNGRRGFIRNRFLQYAFYLFYPAHLLLLYVVKGLIFGF